MTMSVSGWEEEEQVIEAAFEELRSPGGRWLTHVDIAVNSMTTEVGMERKTVTRLKL